MNEKSLNQILFGMLVIFILASSFIPFSGDVYFKKLISEYLFTAVFADQSLTHKIYDNQNPDNYVPVSTEDDDKDDTENICNKLLETCELPNQTTSTDTGVDNGKSDDISEKYFEQDRSTPVTPPTSPVTPSPPTSLNLSESQLTPSPNNETGSPQDNLQLYENPTLGAKISYPMDWNQVENQTNRFSVVTFTSPEQTTQDMSQEKFLIRINNEPTDMSLDEYSANVNESMQNNSNFQVTGSNSTVLANSPAASVTGILKEGNKDLQVLDEWTIKDGKVYRIVFYSDPSKADSFQPLVQNILESFSITK